MQRLNDVLADLVPSYLVPLFWQHGESETVLREEIRQMHSKGIGSFVLEARPHPDFLGERWWYDLDLILDEAQKHGMQVYVFDDAHFPSGFAAGLVRDHHPELLKVYLDERHIDARGPLSGSSFNLSAWLAPGETLVRITAARRADGDSFMDGSTLVDLTSNTADGKLYWDVPVGSWRIFLLVCTRSGGEEGTCDYINPLLPEATRAYLDYVYEPHYHHYASLFGSTFAGFFSDEPRFGNAPTYYAVLGQHRMVLPYSPHLLEQLSRVLGEDFTKYLPLLWYAAESEVTSRIRYTYMDTVSRLYAENFNQPIGAWCRQHQVKLIGHVVEDNGAHARLGFGSGHFFRAISGQDVAGLDVVYQIWPGYDSGHFATPFGDWDADFFHWGIAKLASSAAHIDPKKHGVTVCEAFGAYGWQEGLKLMKWLTDHLCVRGVNTFIPHAFSPKDNDPDCQPHFYARGANPQWRYFGVWSAYANRLCHLFSGGQHIAPAAVLYHAEAEWSGAYQPFHQVVRALAEAQIDCDVLPVDALVDPAACQVKDKRFTINQEDYRALVVPYAERLPEMLLDRLAEMSAAGIPVVLIDGYPIGTSLQPIHFSETIETLKTGSTVSIRSLSALPGHLRSLGVCELEVNPPSPALRVYHYTHPGLDLWFFTNDSRSALIDTAVRFERSGQAAAYDALENVLYRFPAASSEPHAAVRLCLEPYQSLMIVFGEDLTLQQLPELEMPCIGRPVELQPDEWKVSVATAEQYPQWTPTPIVRGPGNAALPGLLPRFSGTLRYETSLHWDGKQTPLGLDLGEVYETAEVWLNERTLGVRICPPYRFGLAGVLQPGENQLKIEVTNTLAKARGDNVFDRAMPQEPSGLIGPLRLLFE
jgi:hypothetical protein